MRSEAEMDIDPVPDVDVDIDDVNEEDADRVPGGCVDDEDGENDEEEADCA